MTHHRATRLGLRPGLRLVAGVAIIALAAIGCEQEIVLFPQPEAPPVVEYDDSTPNIVLITLDTTRADALGSYGQALAPTPYLDQLAAEGVLFENCETAAPNTLPAHATLFTGRFPFAHGVRSNTHFLLPETQITLAEALGTTGYATGAEVAAPVLNANTQLDQGFQHYGDLRPVAIEARRLARERRQLDRGEAPSPPEPSEAKPVLVIEPRIAADITDEGIRFIEAHAERQFFLWLHYFDPHMPYGAPAEYAQRQPNSDYHAEVMYTDAQIDRFISALRRLSLAGRTLVVITSDHGESLNQHTEETHGFYVYRSTIHVPLILWGLESLPKDKRIASLVRTVDIAPTLLDYANREPLSDIHGVSLRPLIEGEASDLALASYSESAEPLITFGATPLRSLTRGQWRYIHKVNPELYDLASDRHEAINLADRDPERLAAFQQELVELVQSRASGGGDATQRMSPEIQQQLMALGYASGSAPAEAIDSPAAIALGGVDPNDLTDDLRQLTEAGGLRHEGQFDEARTLYRELWDRHPTSLPVLVGLIEATAALGLVDEQIPLLERLIELDPDESAAYSRLATLLHEEGNTAGFERVLYLALDRFPCNEAVRLRLALLAHTHREYREEHELLHYAISNCEPSDTLRNNYAFLLATSPIDELRDGLEAVAIAKEIVARASPPNPAYHDTLAASYAEVEIYHTAAQIEQQAIDLLVAQGAEDEIIEIFREHLATFENEQPLRSP